MLKSVYFVYFTCDKCASFAAQKIPTSEHEI